jgi:parallel beta-helix repeat protein
MKIVKMKFILITILYLTSISIVGWNGDPYQAEELTRALQVNENTDLLYSELPTITQERDLTYSTLIPKSLPVRDHNNIEINYELIDQPKLSIESVQYISHSVIVINNDDDFTRQNFTGAGTFTNPYLISDFEITANHTHLITIRDTTKYFLISNNQLDGISGSFDGIYLQNVTNGRIESNVILSNNYGVRFYNSDGNNMTSNSVNSSTLNGIYLINSYNNFVDNNDVYVNVHGISLTDSWSNTIDRNWVSDNQLQGIALYNSSFVNVSGNTVWNNGEKGIFDNLSVNNTFVANNARFNGHDGIYSYNCNNSKFISNVAYNNTWNGIVSQGNSVHNHISQNSAFNNSGMGLRLNNLSYSTIDTNYIYQNLENGIWLEHSSHNLIRNNDVDRNSLCGIFLLGNSDDNRVQENTLYENHRGIRVDNASNTKLVLNSIDSSSAQGILVLTADSVEITDNLITNSWGSGMWLSDISNGVVRNNELYENMRASLESPDYVGAGITAAAFSGNISSNHLGGNYYWGIMVMNSGEHDISHNMIVNNSETGLVIDNTNGTTINNNEMAGNLGNGMLINNSHGNQVLYNVIYQNGANGISIINSNSNYIYHNDIFDNYGSTIGFPIRYSQLSEANIEPMVIIDRIEYSIMGSTSGHGIFADPSSGNTIEFNNLYGNFGSGAYLFEVTDTDFNDNFISENGENGVFLENSNDNRLIGNTIIGNDGSLLKDAVLNSNIKFSIKGSTSGHGIFADPSMGNTIKGNEISHNILNGIALFESENSIIDDNIVTKNGNGIYLEDSGHNSITGNIIAKNGIQRPPPDDSKYSDIKYSIMGSTSGHGIFADPSDYITIDHNIIFGNENHGIYLMDSDYVAITNNSISVNRLYGVFVDLNSDFSVIKVNDFNSNNFLKGSQVSDDGAHGDCDRNYWSDLIGDVYLLDGLAENRDANPAAAPYFPPGYEFTAPTLVYPNGGETLSGVVTIQWKIASNEKYPDEISYYVFYSGDARSEWLIIPFAQITTSTDPTGQKLLNIEWDTKQGADGSENLIQVVAVDKVGSVVSDISDNVFQIKNGIDTTEITTTDSRTTGTSTPSITPAWTIIGTLISISSFGWLSIRKRRNN